MSRTVEIFFDYTCPYAYLASTQIEALAARAGGNVVWRPMLLGGVFAAVGTPQRLFATLSPAKAKHNGEDLDRFAALFGVPLRFPAGHPLRSVEALRATIAVGCDPKVIHGFYRAYWAEGRLPSDEATLRDVLGAAGHDADAVLAKIATPELKDALRAATDEAVARGVFGVPACFVDGELYWGQDRLDEVERALRGDGFAPGWGAPPAAPAASPSGETLELYWDFSSPWAYLATEQAAGLAARTGATLAWKPMLLGGLFRAIGQVEAPILAMGESKRRHTRRDLERAATRLGVPLRWPTRFPVKTVELLRIWLALPEPRRDAFRAAAMRAVWAEDRDVADEAVLRTLIGQDADAVLARARTDEVKGALRAATEEAERAGVFGAPTWRAGDALWWGQDRVALVERALSR